MLCSLSNKVPQEPVVSKTNGALYERRLIEKYIDLHHKCPLTGEPLSRNDLIIVSGPTSPTTGHVASIPSLLTTLQSEWDSVMLEQFSLRQQLSQAHQELSHALYQHEASCRVIAKLIRERDVLLSKLHQHDPNSKLPDEDDTLSDALPKEVIDEIDFNKKRLQEERGRRAVPHNLASPEEISTFAEDDNLRPHSTGASAAGVLCIGIVENSGRCFAITGGSDGRVSSYDVQNRSLRGSMIGHTKPVRCVRCIDDIVLSGSDDSTIRVWKDSVSGYQLSRVVKAHHGGVVGFSVLPSNRHILSAGTDGRLAFTDFEKGFTLATGETENARTGFSSFALQPDGIIAVTGSAGKSIIWDVREMRVIHVLGDGTQGSVTSVCVNEDGYTMAASMGHGQVKLYDLRNLYKPLADIVPFDSSPNRQIPSNKVAFSKDGSYLAVASQVVQIWDWKSHRDIATLASHSEPVTDVAWGADAHWIASTSLDKTMRIYRKRN